MKRLLLYILLTLCGVCAFAQTPKEYYVKMIDKGAKEDAVMELCKKYGKKDTNVTEATFLKIFEDALSLYIKQVANNEKYYKGEIDLLNNEIRQLTSENNSLEVSITQMRKDSADIAIKLSKSNIGALVNDSIEKYKAARKTENTYLNINKEALKDSIDKLQALIDLRRSIISKNEVLANEQKNNEGFAGVAALYDDMKNSIERCLSTCTNGNVAIDSIGSLYKEIEHAINVFDSNKSSLPEVGELEEKIDLLRQYKPLAKCLYDAKEQMAYSVFDNTANQTIKKKLAIEARNVKLSDSQQKEMRGIVASLEDQQYALKNLRATLDELLYYEKIDDTNRKEVLNDCILFNVTSFNGNGNETYNRYYKHFNKILHETIENINKKRFTKEEFDKFIKSQKEKLKSK